MAQQNITKGGDSDLVLAVYEEDGTTQLDLTGATQILAEIRVGNQAVTNGRFALQRTGDTASHGVMKAVAGVGNEHKFQLEVEAERSKDFLQGTYDVAILITTPDLDREDQDRKVPRLYKAVGNIVDRGVSSLVG